ncbi:two-component system, NtrC family, response regulator [Thermotomaculum hydrothermale]|uniref:Two-component system, NtrC family, response regulator n=1 Tax=Thermotomaculum hydrothermale TaxID=981385 RepID=A0A7R6PM24_9BACT|nr:sigma-54 dependent transcriptional regulator [Thermotomaculum hydrothermale]BBB32048.1 two-component system, NtrC family, response regulator [Thermotomaculum hydrothermale]
MTRVLIVEDRESLREMLRDFLSERYYVFDAESAEEAEKHLLHYPDIILCDLKLPGISGIEFIDIVKERCPESEIIIMTAFGDIPTAVEAMRKGAFDFIPKPLDLNLLAVLIEKAEKTIALKRKIDNGEKKFEVIGESPIFKNTLSIAKRYADEDIPVLILGESGSGKEIIARYIHLNSKRKDRMFVPINSSAIPASLFESEIFGYSKGAFTGAINSKKGLIEVAEGGTVFFDEIGDLPLNLQAKILRLIESGEYQRVGGERFLKANVRFLFATNKDIKEMVNNGTFREDLYHRISAFTVKVPPLRERPEDIPLLLNYFLEKSQKGKSLKIDKKTLETLKKMEWRGNVRELKNLVEKWVIFGEVFFDRGISEIDDNIRINLDPDKTFRKYQEDFEKKILEFYLKKHKGNKLAMAKELDMNYKTLLSKLAKYGL